MTRKYAIILSRFNSLPQFSFWPVLLHDGNDVWLQKEGNTCILLPEDDVKIFDRVEDEITMDGISPLKTLSPNVKKEIIHILEMMSNSDGQDDLIRSFSIFLGIE